MAIAFVQSKVANTASASSLAASFPSNVTAGNLVVVGIVTSGAGTSVSSVTDTAGNTYTRRVGRTFLAGAGGGEIWEAHNVIGGFTTVTASFSGAVAANVAVAEYSGIEPSSPFDKNAATTGSSTSPSSGNTATTTVANELLFGIITYGASTLTAGSGYTIRETGNFQSSIEDKIVSATGTYPADGTLSVSGVWTASIVTFKGFDAPVWLPTYPTAFVPPTPRQPDALAFVPAPAAPTDTIGWLPSYPDWIARPKGVNQPSFFAGPIQAPTDINGWLPTYPDWLARLRVADFPAFHVGTYPPVAPLTHIGWEPTYPDRIWQTTLPTGAIPSLALDPFPRPVVNLLSAWAFYPDQIHRVTMHPSRMPYHVPGPLVPIPNVFVGVIDDKIHLGTKESLGVTAQPTLGGWQAW